MGIALLALVDLFSPLHSLASRWMPPRRPSNPDGPAGPRCAAGRPDRAARTGTPFEPQLVSRHAEAAPRPLRVVRTVDAQRRSGVSGRLVLSGRMVDVCAELDRLAALEAAQTSRGAGTLH